MVRRREITPLAPLGPLQKAKENEVPAKLVDVAHEVMREDLAGIEKGGYPFVERRKFKEKVRRKVKDLSLFHGEDDVLEEMLEEVTEKITEAAEADPYYQRRFEDDETGK